MQKHLGQFCCLFWGSNERIIWKYSVSSKALFIQEELLLLILPVPWLPFHIHDNSSVPSLANVLFHLQCLLWRLGSHLLLESLYLWWKITRFPQGPLSSPTDKLSWAFLHRKPFSSHWQKQWQSQVNATSRKDLFGKMRLVSECYY